MVPEDSRIPHELSFSCIPCRTINPITNAVNEENKHRANLPKVLYNLMFVNVMNRENKIYMVKLGHKRTLLL